MFASPYHQVSSRCSRSSVPRLVYEYMYVLTFPACIRFISAVCVHIAQHRICQAEIIRMNRGKQQKLQIPPPSSDEVRYLVEAKLLGQDTTIHSKVHCTTYACCNFIHFTNRRAKAAANLKADIPPHGGMAFFFFFFFFFFC